MPENNKPFWFLDSLTYIRVSSNDNADSLSAIEFLAPQGSSPPLYTHLQEDELFHVLDGELRVLVDGRELTIRKGDTALGPRGKPHTFLVTSKTARFLIVTHNGLFERFVRALARPAETEAMPPQEGPPSPDQIKALTEIAKAHAIEIVGPPLA